MLAQEEGNKQAKRRRMTFQAPTPPAVARSRGNIGRANHGRAGKSGGEAILCQQWRGGVCRGSGGYKAKKQKKQGMR